MTTKRLAVLPAALVLAFLGTAGLAVAGVSLPDTARAPFDAVGLQLPNQSRASDVHAVIDATQPGDRGCAFGQAVAAAASQGRSHAPADACDHAQGGDSSQGEAHSQGAAHSGAAADENQTDESGQPSGVPPTMNGRMRMAGGRSTRSRRAWIAARMAGPITAAILGRPRIDRHRSDVCPHPRWQGACRNADR